MIRGRFVPVFALATVVASVAMASACGAKSELRTSGSDATSGGGGDVSATAPSSSQSTGASSSSSGVACAQLEVREPVGIMTAGTVGVGRAPEIAPSADGFAYHVSIEPVAGDTNALVLRVLDAFGAWPPNVPPPTVLSTGVAEHALGPGPNGPSALLLHVDDAPTIATQIVPQIVETPAQVLVGDAPLLVAGIPDRFLFAEAADFGGAARYLRVGSYQPNGLPQIEQPEDCMGSRVLGAVVPAGAGFLGVFGLPDPPGFFDCNGPLYASIVSVARYSAPSTPGSFIERTEGVQLQTKDRLEHLAIAPSSFGAWVVYQTAGLDAETPPAIRAFQVDASGNALASADVAVSPQGTYQALAAAPLGDALAVAWIDALDPSSPSIIVQVVRPDLSLGPATSFSTGALWYTGRLRMISSLDGQTLLLSWESALDDQWQRALGRVDCLGGR